MTTRHNHFRVRNMSRLTQLHRFERIDTLVNNASKQIKCPDIADIDLDNVESTFRSNILQMFAITKYSLPHMKEGSR